MEWRSFDEWNEVGARIHKGAKATNGRFSRAQVWFPDEQDGPEAEDVILEQWAREIADE